MSFPSLKDQQPPLVLSIDYMFRVISVMNS